MKPFETERNAAIKTHLAAGFEKRAEKDGIVEVEITRLMWMNNRNGFEVDKKHSC